MPRLLTCHQAAARVDTWLNSLDLEPVRGWSLDCKRWLKPRLHEEFWTAEQVITAVTRRAEDVLDHPADYLELPWLSLHLGEVYQDNAAAIENHHGRPVKPDELHDAVSSWLDTVLCDLASHVYDAIETTLPAALRD